MKPSISTLFLSAFVFALLSGAITITGGTLTAATSSGSALGSTSAITVNSGGTVLLGASNEISNIASITLDEGTFAKENFSEGSTITAGAGALTLTASGSHLDFGTGTADTIIFASITPSSLSLTIDNWTETPNTVENAATDRLVFNSDQSANLSSFTFGYAPGTTEVSLGNGYYEEVPLAPVPEPATYFAAALALGALAWHRWRSLRRHLLRVFFPI